MSARQYHKTRQPVFAGMFYPGDAGELRQMVQFCLAGALPCAKKHGLLKAFVLPHAGFVYSGPIAGAGYRCLEEGRGSIRRIVLLGPSHRVAFDGIAVSEHNAFATPLGEVPVDEAASDALLGLSQVHLLESAHAQEHSLEVQLPFLQVALDSFKVVPLVVGEASAEEIGAVLEQLWGGPETRIVVSSDLSHYHDYTQACHLDRETAGRIEKLEPVMPDQACGSMPLNGLLHAARKHRLTPHTIDLRNSGDTAGERARVVGYGAFGFSEN
jgi:AmmeMemoRadiSam system protein B